MYFHLVMCLSPHSHSLLSADSIFYCSWGAVSTGTSNYEGNYELIIISNCWMRLSMI